MASVNDGDPSYLIDGYESYFYALNVGKGNDLCLGEMALCNAKLVLLQFIYFVYDLEISYII